jgi:hypothetical protein
LLPMSKCVSCQAKIGSDWDLYLSMELDVGFMHPYYVRFVTNMNIYALRKVVVLFCHEISQTLVPLSVLMVLSEIPQ